MRATPSRRLANHLVPVAPPFAALALLPGAGCARGPAGVSHRVSLAPPWPVFADAGRLAVDSTRVVSRGARLAIRPVIARPLTPTRSCPFTASASLITTRRTRGVRGWASAPCEGAWIMIPEQEEARPPAAFQERNALGVVDGVEEYVRALGAAT